MDIPILLAVILFWSLRSSHCWLSKIIKLNRLCSSLQYLSIPSSLLQHSPSLLSHGILPCTVVFQLTLTIATSLVPYKSLCWSLARFTPDVMPTVIRSSLAFLTDTNVTTCFQHRLFNITRLLSLVHSIRLFESHLQESLSPFFLIVHHKVCFHLCSIRWFANYLWRSSAEGLLSSFCYSLASSVRSTSTWG